DRNYYVCGEILWFKTYVTNASNNKPLSLSKVVYVEILNSRHEPVLQAKISLENGTGSGSFSLPLSLEGGNLVNGLNSVVAFKINNDAGKGVEGTGIVLDQSNDTIAHFQTEKFGM